MFKKMQYNKSSHRECSKIKENIVLEIKLIAQASSV